MQSGSGRQSCNSGMAAAAAVAHVGFWVALGVCGELWEVRLGSCNGDVSRQHKNKTRKLNILHFD